MEMAVKTAERAARSAGRRRRGESFPAAGIMGERRPLASLLRGFLGPSPMEMGSMGGRQKRGFGGWRFVVGGVLHELGFLHLYIFSDFRHPI